MLCLADGLARHCCLQLYLLLLSSSSQKACVSLLCLARSITRQCRTLSLRQTCETTLLLTRSRTPAHLRSKPQASMTDRCFRLKAYKGEGEGEVVCGDPYSDLCSAFNPSKCTQTVVNCTWSSGQPMLRLELRCLLVVFEGRERWLFTPPTTIPAS